MRTTSPEVLWEAPPAMREAAEMTALAREVGAPDYPALWRGSVADVERFWATLWTRFDVQADGDPTQALTTHAMPGARWFPGVVLFLPEQVFRGRAPDALALQFASEEPGFGRWSWAELEEQVARIRAGLVALGVERGDRVAAYLPNVPEAVAAFLAPASLGAVWSCCSPDFGTRTVLDRFGQITPKVLLAVDGYRYGGKAHDRRAVVAELAAALPSVERTVVRDRLFEEGDCATTFGPTDEPLVFVRVPFDHPLWVVYSSGTTGAPKAIVHGHGGPLLEHLTSTSGGTDIAGGFVGGSALMPVVPGELPALMLGVAVAAWDDDGHPLEDEVSELVVTEPMPSMPVGFWDDPGDVRYLEHFPGVWRHGDWIRAAVLVVPGVEGALAVDVPSPDGTGDGWLGLFVVLAAGTELDDALVAELRRRFRADCSPGHVPDEVLAAPDLPRPLTGKPLEVPVKKLLMGRDPGGAANAGSLANLEAFAWFADWARERAA